MCCHGCFFTLFLGHVEFCTMYSLNIPNSMKLIIQEVMSHNQPYPTVDPDDLNFMNYCHVEE